VAAIMAEPAALYRAFITGTGATTQAVDVADTLLHMGLSIPDQAGVRRAALAEAVPTPENGLWKLSPNGQMELVWRVRPGATWHDGTPLTADDLLFTVQLLQDRELPEFRAPASNLIDHVESLDPSTLSTTWKQPFIRADRLFSGGSEGLGEPLPKHLLERAYLDNKDTFRQLPYWRNEFIGLGPYKLREWTPGSALLLGANDRYVLGRPRIEEMEIRFIQDANTVVANILSGAVQATVGTGLSLEQSIEVRDHWLDGKMLVAFENWILVYPQFVNPDPPLQTDVRFRRAALMAIDRQAMADTIQAGLVPAAHSYVRPDEPEYAETERSVVRYAYDPPGAARLLEHLGYTRGPDAVLRDVSGEPLGSEVRASSSPAIHTKAMFPVADYLQRLGIVVDPVVIPVQRANDPEYRATHPSFEVVRQPNGPGSVERLHSAQAPMPQNRFAGGNRSRYMNAEFDGLIDQYLATIPREPSMRVLGQIVHHISDQLNVMGLFYDLRTTLISNRLEHVSAQYPTWNAHEWELKS
jgi:peptide/nickel transport system substrate-binding protein